MEKFSFTCSCCGRVYDEMPLCFGADHPVQYFDVAPEQRENRIELTESLCVIDETHFFHRGRITIPVIDYTDDLIFNVWTSISRDNFELRNSIWNDQDRSTHGPYFGWLSTVVPTYGDTINIKTMAYESDAGAIPSIQVFEEGHALTNDQQSGITFEQAKEKVQEILAKLHKDSWDDEN
jgi:hypothetical protein